MAQAECLPDLAFGERLLAGHQVRLDSRDRRGDAPCSPHVAPCLGELDPDLLGGLVGRLRFGGRTRTVRRVRGRTAVDNLRLDSSRFIAHNLLYQSSTLGEPRMSTTGGITALFLI